MNIDNNEDVFKAFDKLDKDLHIELLGKITQNALKYSKRFALKNYKTGQMERELVSKINNNSSSEIVANAPHTIFVHFGTKPHIIEPKDKGYLRWATGVNFRYAKKIHHPGYKGNPFIYDGIKKAFSEVDKLLDEINL